MTDGMDGLDNPDMEEWVDEGPVVRPYALTRGRVRPTSGKLDLMSRVVVTGTPVPYDAELGPYHRRLLAAVTRSRPLVEVAAETELPIGVVRVLLSDLLDHGLIRVRPPITAEVPANESILREVINGLRAL
ncbi:MAG TPA: DUF742 domain-containing protein [Thermopolyspora sp.]